MAPVLVLVGHHARPRAEPACLPISRGLAVLLNKHGSAIGAGAAVEFVPEARVHGWCSTATISENSSVPVGLYWFHRPARVRYRSSEAMLLSASLAEPAKPLMRHSCGGAILLVATASGVYMPVAVQACVYSRLLLAISATKPSLNLA